MNRWVFLLPDAGALDALDALRLRPGVEREDELVVYDTFDGRLWAERSLLFFDAGRLQLRFGEHETVVPEQPVRVLADELPAGPLRDALGKLLEERAALPQVRLIGTARRLRVLDELDKTVALIEVRDPAVVLPSGRRVPLHPRASIWPVRGYEEETGAVATALGERFEPCEQPLYADAMAALGRSPEGVSAKIEVPLVPEERTDAAAVAVLERLLEVIDANLPGTLADTDSEFLHDYRVAIRRTRSVQRELAGAFPPAELARIRAEFKWLQQATGDSRDLDVYVLGFGELRDLVPEDMRDDLGPLLAVLRSRRLAARRAMVRELRSPRAELLRGEWGVLLASLVALADDERPDGPRPIGEVAAERIRKVYRRMVRMGDAIDSSSPPEDYHELRKKGKELRYLLELFGAPLFDSAVVKPMVRSLKALQDVLGRHQDREVQTTMLRSLRDDVAALPGGPAALMAMGVLVQVIESDAAAARGEFAERFAAFASKEQRRVVKDTFS